jgi:hypothetical protein
MPSFITSHITARGLAPDEDLVLVQGASITSNTLSPALYTYAGGHEVTLGGTVWGNTGFATLTGFGVGPSPLASRLEVLRTGTLTGVEAAIVLTLATFTLHNAGQITAGGTGLRLLATPGGSDLSLSNTGEIRAGGRAVQIDAGGGEGSVTLINRGLIEGGGNLVYLSEGDTTYDLIVNHGTIVGDIDTGGAHDTVINHGAIEGAIATGAGDDRVNLRWSDDPGTLVALGAGNDTFRGGVGEDTVEGDAGFDWVSYDRAGAVRVSLSAPETNTGLARGDFLSGIEGIEGSLLGADVLIGDPGATHFRGLGGNDSLTAGAGNDTLEGGTGADLLTAGPGDDAFLYRWLSEGGDRITDFGRVPGNDDRVLLWDAGIAAGLPAGPLDSARFVTRANDLAAPGPEDRVIFRTSDTTLWWDPDGSGSGVAVLLADLQAGAVVTAADIVVFF